MAKITFIDPSGTAHTVDGEIGSTVMETAIRNNIAGIEAECGGACACATCHVYVDEAWREKTGEPSPMEEDMLDFGYDVRPNSRLSCQIKVSDELDGLVVHGAGEAGVSVIRAGALIAARDRSRRAGLVGRGPPWLKAPIKTTCCIAGGGPAGMMLGFLLARAGVAVTVLEKHADFLRDFRGDTIHPSTLELMYELGLLDEFLKLPHSRSALISPARSAMTTLTLADFSHLPTHCKFIALMPQWDFLDFLAAHGKRYPKFDLRMKDGSDRPDRGGRARRRPAGEDGGRRIEIGADLVVGCDGRHSTVRVSAGFAVDNLGAPIDVLWFRVSRRASDTAETFGHMEAGRMMVMLNRNDYWQCAYVIPKGGIDRVKAKGLAAFRDIAASCRRFCATGSARSKAGTT